MADWWEVIGSCWGWGWRRIGRDIWVAGGRGIDGWKEVGREGWIDEEVE